MTIQIDTLPKTVEEFILLRNQISNTPEGGAAAIIVALLLYSQDKTLGRQAMIIQSNPIMLQKSESKGSYKGFNFTSSMQFLLTQLDQKLYLPNSYVIGTSNTNGYLLPSLPFVIELTRNDYSNNSDGSIKVFVKCTGADTPRPITLEVNDKGVWKAKECSSLFVGIKAPVKITGDADGDF